MSWEAHVWRTFKAQKIFFLQNKPSSHSRKTEREREIKMGSCFIIMDTNVDFSILFIWVIHQAKMQNIIFSGFGRCRGEEKRYLWPGFIHSSSRISNSWSWFNDLHSCISLGFYSQWHLLGLIQMWGVERPKHNRKDGRCCTHFEQKWNR